MMSQQLVLGSHVDGDFEALGEGFEQCDGNLDQVPRCMAILKPSEKESNNVMAICYKFPGGWLV